MEQQKITLTLTQDEMILLRDAINNMRCELSTVNGVVRKDRTQFSERRLQGIDSCVDIKNQLVSQQLKHFGK